MHLIEKSHHFSSWTTYLLIASLWVVSKTTKIAPGKFNIFFLLTLHVILHPIAHVGKFTLL